MELMFVIREVGFVGLERKGWIESDVLRNGGERKMGVMVIICILWSVSIFLME